MISEREKNKELTSPRVLLWLTFCILTEMLPVERVVANWGRLDWPGPLYSLAPLYKHAKACPASAVTRRSNLCKHKRSSTSLTTFILNWAHFFQPIDEIYTVKKSYLFLEGRCKFPAPSLQKFVGDTGKFFPFPKALFLCFQRGKPFHSGERAFFHV